MFRCRCLRRDHLLDRSGKAPFAVYRKQVHLDYIGKRPEPKQVVSLIVNKNHLFVASFLDCLIKRDLVQK